MLAMLSTLLPIVAGAFTVLEKCLDIWEKAQVRKAVKLEQNAENAKDAEAARTKARQIRTNLQSDTAIANRVREYSRKLSQKS